MAGVDLDGVLDGSTRSPQGCAGGRARRGIRIGVSGRGGRSMDEVAADCPPSRRCRDDPPPPQGQRRRPRWPGSRGVAGTAHRPGRWRRRRSQAAEHCRASRRRTAGPGFRPNSPAAALAFLDIEAGDEVVDQGAGMSSRRSLGTARLDQEDVEAIEQSWKSISAHLLGPGRGWWPRRCGRRP